MLEYFGWFLIVVTPLLIAVPYARGKSELITCWNLVLLSVMIYLGMGSLEVVYGELTWPTLRWFTPSAHIQTHFVMGSWVFVCSLLFFYYVPKLPERLAARRLATWPKPTAIVSYAMLAFCVGLIALYLVMPPVPVVSGILVNVSHKAAVAAAVFALYCWRVNKNAVTLSMFVGVLAACALYAMLVFSGRRLLLSMACVPVFAYYWWSLRYKAPRANLIRVAVALMMVLMLSSAYQTFRFFNKGMKAETKERSVATLLEQMSRLDMGAALRPITRDMLHYGAQYCGFYAMLTMHYHEAGVLETEPLGSLKWIASYPAPRKWWPEKPQTIGIRLPKVANIRGNTNWGITAVGHGFLEGGYPVIVLYALIAVIGVRLIDTPLKQSPDNPFLLALLCIVAPHTVGWVRGDIAIMSTEIIEGVVFIVILGVLGRLVFGSEKKHPAGVTYHYLPASTSGGYS